MSGRVSGRASVGCRVGLELGRVPQSSAILEPFCRVHGVRRVDLGLGFGLGLGLLLGLGLGFSVASTGFAGSIYQRSLFDGNLMVI